MFRKRSTPGSSKSTSPVPPEFESEIDDAAIIEVVEDNEIPPHIDVNVNIEVEELDPRHSDLSGDTAQNPSIHYDFTSKHPMGQILLNLLTENTKLADKVNLKGMEMSIDNLCRNFYNAQLLGRQKIKSKIMQTTSGLETALISREMNSHILNQSIEPPQRFSPVPTFLTPRQRADCMKLLPSNKFSGSDKGMSILEYLHLLKMVQSQCNVSLPEFLEIMLASTTGEAYLLLHGWIDNGDDVATIFHNLLIHYDKRLKPEEARLIVTR